MAKIERGDILVGIAAVGAVVTLAWEATTNFPALDESVLQQTGIVCPAEAFSVDKTDLRRQVADLLSRGIHISTPEVQAKILTLGEAEACYDHRGKAYGDAGESFHLLLSVGSAFAGIAAVGYLTRSRWYRADHY